MAIGNIWVEGNDLKYIDASGTERSITGTAGGASGATAGYIWIESSNLKYIDASGNERSVS